MNSKRNEQAIKKAIIQWVNHQPNCRVWDNQNQGTWDSQKGIYRKSKAREWGTPDILGWVTVEVYLKGQQEPRKIAWTLAIETKTVEGLKKYNRDKHDFKKTEFYQHEWGLNAKYDGAIHIVATKIETVYDRLKELGIAVRL